MMLICVPLFASFYQTGHVETSESSYLIIPSSWDVSEDANHSSSHQNTAQKANNHVFSNQLPKKYKIYRLSSRAGSQRYIIGTFKCNKIYKYTCHIYLMQMSILSLWRFNIWGIYDIIFLELIVCLYIMICIIGLLYLCLLHRRKSPKRI